MAILEVENVTFSYEGQPLLDHLSFTLQEGEITALIGVSGSGKTTLFKAITEILPLEDGVIKFHGRGRVAYMTQEDLLLPWRTLLENVLLPSELGVRTTASSTLRNKALELLEELGLKNYADHLPAELSGGMRQRASLARALLQESSLLLLDEPFVSLDVILQEQMYALLKKMRAKRGLSLLLITHDFRDALYLADRVLLLSEGTIQREWTITPADRENGSRLHELQDQMRTSLAPHKTFATTITT